MICVIGCQFFNLFHTTSPKKRDNLRLKLHEKERTAYQNAVLTQLALGKADFEMKHPDKIEENFPRLHLILSGDQLFIKLLCAGFILKALIMLLIQ
jgi:hypothetical protein